MKRLILIPIILLAIAPAVPAAEAPTEPMAALRGPIDKVVSILKDPELKGPEKQDEQRQAIVDVVEKIFDFEKISKLALGRFRRTFNDQQMERYTELFTDLLIETYLNQVQKEFQNEEVTYLEQMYHPSDSERAMVKTLILRKNTEVPVDYSMYSADGSWRIYDVKVEGVSLVKNYRTQFEKILLQKSPDALIEKLEKKGIDSQIETKG
jgi:phospholipid transport system substrate-binding protein